MTDFDAVLIRVLAAADALLLPVRDWHSHTAANRVGRSSMAGIPYRVSTRGDEAGRKSSEQSLIDLVGQGLIAMARSTRVRFPLLNLTPKGESRARALCGLPGRADGRKFLAEVANRSRLYHPYPIGIAPARWVPEVVFNKGRGWGPSTKAERDGLARIELRFLPAASRGWVATNSLIGGNVGYCITKLGEAELAKATAEPDFGNLPKRDVAARALYREEQDARLVSLASDVPSVNAICLPLGTSAFVTEADLEQLENRP